MPLETFGYNDLPSGAQSVSFGSVYFCDFNGYNDVDYFSFTISSASKVYLELYPSLMAVRVKVVVAPVMQPQPFCLGLAGMAC